MVLLMGMFGTAQPALLAFPEERPVFLREYSTNHYNVLSYFLARFTMEAFITSLQVMTQVNNPISVFLIHIPQCWSCSDPFFTLVWRCIHHPAYLLLVPSMLFHD
jgi:hypothetical protein